MAATVNYQDIEKKLKVFKEGFSPSEIPYIILGAFGTSDTYIRRYKEGKGVVARFDGLMIKGKIAYRQTDTLRMTEELERMKRDENIRKAAPRIIMVSDGTAVLAYDPKEEETYDNKLSSLWLDFQFFYPLCGVERYRGVEENPADVKAAEKMAKLHDEIRRYNEFSSSDDIHDLNIFMTRLLFCFFAEDTGIFDENLFTKSIAQYTQEDGSDLATYLDSAFNIMDKDVRIGVPSVISQFPYVNGGLFRKRIAIPEMSRRARKLIIECGELNWKDINPDIFGSMIQAVVTPDQRGVLGMHYTSVPNIMKVIQPLFLDELYEEFAKHKDNVKKLRMLLVRISKMKFFDPACGSGNFLIIAYKELRKLEIQIWQRIAVISGQIEIPFVHIQLNQFFGIEIDDFAHEVAMLSLWLAEHQMNCMFTRSFSNVVIPALPLKTNCNIVHGNACRVDWNVVCPHTPEEEVFVFGNPPYLGSKVQDKYQKSDVTFVFGDIKNSKILDYIAIWFYLAAEYIKETKGKYAFVSTNSICQGEQVGVLWPEIYKMNLNIHFAHKSFKWSNNAKHNAGVTCVIVGVCNKSENCLKHLFHNNKSEEVKFINPYLMSNTEIIVYKNTEDPDGLPKLCFGCMPYDDKNNKFLRLDEDQRRDLIERYPESETLIRKIYGSDEFIKGKSLYCLWIDDEEYDLACNIPPIKERIEGNRYFRLNESVDGQELANRPHQFREHPEDKDKIIIPRVSSENRLYIPMGFLQKEDVVSDSAFALYDAPMWLFGILTSLMHMAWVKTVGGRLETRYRYSAQLCYNTFPFPKISEEKKKEIEAAAEEVLLVRRDYPLSTLADLYDPDKMPDDLREAHHNLDLVVESCYQDKPFANDEERLECLFKLYEKMTKK